MVSGNWDKPDEYLGYINTFQDNYGIKVMPDKSKMKMEILYNKINIFKRLFPVFALSGFLLLILLFTGLLMPRYKFNVLNKIIIVIIGLSFMGLTLGLAARWYIAGHAPWSNGYETMIYIAWGIVLSGFLFARKSMISLATTAILAALASSLRDKPVPADTLVLGEVGLTGEVRRVADRDARLREAARHGFRRAVLAEPDGAATAAPQGLEMVTADSVESAVALALEPGARSARG